MNRHSPPNASSDLPLFTPKRPYILLALSGNRWAAFLDRTPPVCQTVELKTGVAPGSPRCPPGSSRVEWQSVINLSDLSQTGQAMHASCHGRRVGRTAG